MKQKEFMISRISFNQMIPFNNHKQRTNKINSQQFNYISKNHQTCTPKNTFVCRRPQSNPQFYGKRSNKDGKLRNINNNSSQIDFTQSSQSTNYKAFPQRSLTKPRKSSRSISSSMSNRKNAVNFENDIIVLQKTLHLQVTDLEQNTKSKQPEKEQLKSYMINRRAQSCRKMIRTIPEQEANQVISPWQQYQHNDFYKL